MHLLVVVTVAYGDDRESFAIILIVVIVSNADSCSPICW